MQKFYKKQNLKRVKSNHYIQITISAWKTARYGFGIIFGIIAIPLLIALATKSENIAGVIGASIYGFCFLQLFTFSTLYHGFQNPQVKRALEILDHISIYFLIAGTYTAFILIYLNSINPVFYPIFSC